MASVSAVEPDDARPTSSLGNGRRSAPDIRDVGSPLAAGSLRAPWRDAGLVTAPARFAPRVGALRWVGGAYLLLLGLALLILQPAPLNSPVDSEIRGAVTALGGLALLWLAGLAPRRSRALTVSTAVALPQLWFAAEFLRQGIVPGAATLGLLAAALLLTAALPARSAASTRADALGLVFGAAQAVQGVSYALRPQSADPIPAALGLSAGACAALLMAGGAAVVLAQLLPRLPTPAYRAAHLFGGAVTLVMWAAVGLRIDTAYLYLGAATLVRGASIAALPWLSDRLERFDGRALGARLALALGTAALVPLLVAAPLVLDATVGRAGRPDVRQAVFGGVLLLAVASGLAAWWISRRLVAPIAALVAAVEGVAAGRRMAALPDAVTELARLGDAVETMAATIGAREASLERRRREFETLVEHAPDIVARFDRELRHLYVNAAVEVATGIPRDAFLGKTNAELGMPSDLVAHWAGYAQAAFATGAEQRYEFAFPSPGGPRHFRTRLVPEIAADGAAETLLAVTYDVTERKEAEEALRRSEAIYRRLAEANLFGVGFGTSTGAVTYVNDEMLRMMGRTREEFAAGRIDWAAAIAPEFREAIAVEAQRVLTEGSASGYEAAFLRPDGGRTPYIAAAALVEPGEDHHVSIALDLTQIHAAEAALRESEARFRTMADETPVIIWATDATGGIAFVNRAYTEFFGVTEDEVRGPNWQPLVHADDAAAYVGAFLAALREGTPFYAEARVRRAGGAWRWIESFGAPHFDAHGELLGMVGSSLDVTDRKEAEEVRIVFLDAVAHDVRNPLGAAKGQAQLARRRLQRENGESGRLEASLHGIEAAIDAASALIDELLDVARLRAGRPLELRLDRVDLVALAEACATETRSSSPRHDIRVEADDLSLVGKWDEDRLERVLRNLLDNAVKYSPDGGEVVVRVAREADADGTDWAILAAQDRGVGIPAGDLPRVFERFHRGGNVGAIVGSGIGLSGVKQIVEQHGGTIVVASVEGQGTTVTVRLPLPAG